MFDWNKYLDLALVLSQPSVSITTDEACMRTSISRAYYAAFNKASIFANTNYRSLVRSLSMSPHDKIIHILKQAPDPNIQDAGIKLERIKRNRKNADYKSSITINYQTVELVFLTATEIISQIP